MIKANKINKLISVSFVNLSYSRSLKDYVLKKIIKHKNEFEHIQSVKIRISPSSNGCHKSYRVLVCAYLPDASFVIKKSGNDIYEIVDYISDVFKRKLVKFLETHFKNYRLACKYAWV